MKVKVNSTGAIIRVYKHSERKVYVDEENCKTEYKASEITVLTK